MCQLDGNDTVDSMSSYDSEEELECEPIRATSIPAPQLAGQAFTLDVDDSEEIAAPSSLPLTMVANFRSAYNKVRSIKQNLYVLGLDFLVASETWAPQTMWLCPTVGEGRLLPPGWMAGRLVNCTLARLEAEQQLYTIRTDSRPPTQT